VELSGQFHALDALSPERPACFWGTYLPHPSTHPLYRFIRLIMNTDWELRSRLLYNLLHTPTVSPLLGSNISHSILFQSDIRLCRICLPYCEDQVSHSYKIRKIYSSCICLLTFTTLDSKWEDKRSYTEWHKAGPSLHLLIISLWKLF
jgi:hypothetical protein